VGGFDKNLYWTAIVYFIGPLMLHALWWEAIIISICMSACWYLSYAQRVVSFFGATILLLGLCVWAGLLPPPNQWPLFHR
jgi:hypothetical protein